MSKENSAQTWYERAVECQEFQKLCGSQDWSVYRDYYRGNFDGSQLADEDVEYFHNLFYVHYHTQVPAWYYRDPRIIVTPEKSFSNYPDPERLIRARVLESVDNLLIRAMGFKQLVEDCGFDAIFCGRGPSKFGYGSMFKQLGDRGESTSSNKEKTEYNTRAKNDLPWAARTGPDELLVPFGTRYLWDCPYLIHIVLRRTTDVANSPYYTGVKNLKGTHVSILQEKLQELQRSKLQDCEFTEIHEVHNFRTGEIGAYIPSSGKDWPNTEWIRVPKPSRMMEILGGLPFDDICFNHDPDYYWVTSDSVQIEPHQLELNETMKQGVMHRRLTLLKFLVNEGMIDKSELDKLLSSRAGAAVQVKGSPKDAVVTLTPHIPQDLPLWGNTTQDNFRHVMGTSKPGSGTEASGRKTATEIQAMVSGQDSRTSKRRDKVAEFLERSMEKVNKLVKALWTLEEIVPVVGLEGAIHWVKFKNSDLSGDYRVKIDVDSMSPVTLAGRRQEIMNMLGALGRDPGVNKSHLMSLLLSQYDWADLPDILPQAGQAPVSMQSFMGQQQGLQPGQINSGLNNAASALGVALPQGG